ncbi:hypothetical protein PAV_2c06050 [Paenibacillus alvei DSM 29]|nr:hypothetical protein PAV_2c06050 [Paenibacillus alvei DSM 29]
MSFEQILGQDRAKKYCKMDCALTKYLMPTYSVDRKEQAAWLLR